MKYYNYHKHDHKGNVRSLDVVVKLEDYCKRAIELEHNAIFTTNHGMQGDLFEATTLAHQYNLKLIVGCECYYVPNRYEKDRSNKHLVIISLNDSGIRQLNKILSIANENGYYYKPRIDHELLFSLNPKDFVITTACVAGILKDKNLVLELHDKFGDNFLLETQNHNEDIQREFNLLALEYHNKYGIKLIHGNDSHYINPEDSKYRELFLKAKGIIYENEGDFILDYPDSNTIIERYKKQGVLTDEQIRDVLENTLIFDKAEEITIINDDIKLPSISDNPNEEIKKIINKAWKKEKKYIPKERIKEYIEAIRYEADIIEKTHMEDYFIIDNKIAELAQSKYGGKLTNTGRGSAPSFYINKLLGLTDIDRLNTPCKLFPTRFMSVERILGARSLPDIDLNTSERQPFMQATKELLGEENCAWMIAWKPLQESSGFRLYCKSINMNINEYDEVAKNLDEYREDEKWKDIIEESKHFVGVVESMSESPCSMLLYNKPIAEEIGLIRIKDKLYCMLDGYNCDKYKYLKNDYLQVKVWAIIKEVCDIIGIPIPTIKELNDLIDDKTFNIYEKGLTCTINQVDSDWATGLSKHYKISSLSEASQFVAMIRPGCASLLSDFLDRKKYSTGVEELDNLLEDSGHRLIYQESIMKYLIWLGISESHSYDIIKKIAKKKFKEKELEELKSELKEGWLKQVGKMDGFDATWTVVEQASKYSFNASHSLSYAYDSLYGAYLKSHYPLEYYSVVLNHYSSDEERTMKLTKELEYFNIKILYPKFRHSQAEYSCDKDTNSIYKGIASIKYMNTIVAEDLYKLKDNIYNNFIELLKDINEKTSCNSRQLDILIKLNYFSEFGNNQKLIKIVEYFNLFNDKKQMKKDKIEELGIDTNIIKNYSRETNKSYMDLQIDNILNELCVNIEDENLSIVEQVKFEKEFLGYIQSTYDCDKNYVVITDIDVRYSPKITVYRLSTGDEKIFKMYKKTFSEMPLETGEIIKVSGVNRKNKSKMVDGKWTKVENEYDLWLTNYCKIEDYKNLR